MPGNVDYILGGAQTLAGGVGDLLKHRAQQAELDRPLHDSFQSYMQDVLEGRMDPGEAATRLKLEMRGHIPPRNAGAPQAPQGQPQAEPFRGVPPSLLTPSLLASAKPTMAPDGDLMSGGPAMSPASGGLMQARPQGSSATPPETSLLQPPAPPSRPFTVRDLGDMEKLAPFYQSQQATQRAVENRKSIEAEGAQNRGSRSDLTQKRLSSQEKVAGDSTAQRERASVRSFTARMAAIKAMERLSKSRSTTAKDVATFLEEGRNLRAERANIAREMAATAQSLNSAASASILQDANRRLQELQKLEQAYEPIRQMMLQRSGLTEDEFEQNLLAPLVNETETLERSTPAGLR